MTPEAWPTWTPGYDWQDLWRYHYTLLHTKYIGFWPCGFREEVFSYFSHYKSKRKAMNRNWCNQKANPALNTKAGNK